MAAPKRTSIQREADLERIAQLYLQGHKQADIAVTLDVSQPQISYDLKTLQKRWAAASVRNIDTAKGEELARIDELERVYWDSWRKSQGLIKVKSVDREKIVLDELNKIHKGVQAAGVAGQDGEIVRTLVRTEKRVGEGKYLDGVQWCINQRCKILGIAAPSKMALTDPSGEKEYGSDGLTDEAAIDRLAAVFNLGRARRDQAASGDNTATDLDTPARATDDGGEQPG